MVRLNKYRVVPGGTAELLLPTGAMLVGVRPGSAGPEAWVLGDPDLPAADRLLVMGVPFGGVYKEHTDRFIGSVEGHSYFALPRCVDAGEGVDLG